MPPSSCFNGATAFQPWNYGQENHYHCPKRLLQWGHGISAVEFAQLHSGIAGLQMLQWGHGISAVEFCMPLCSVPSIGRLQWGHGISAVELQSGFARHDVSLCFNGATAFQPWNYRMLRDILLHSAASMGPRHFSRGIQMRHCRQSQILALQWGHGISAVEFLKQREECTHDTGFNGATAFQPWNSRSQAGCDGAVLGFNGATAFQPWNCR